MPNKDIIRDLDLFIEHTTMSLQLAMVLKKKLSKGEKLPNKATLKVVMRRNAKINKKAPTGIGA